MKHRTTAILALSIFLLLGFALVKPTAPDLQKKMASGPTGLRDGDILFQVTSGGQSEAISLATGSEWTHVGVLLNDGGNWFVYEAVGPVKRTPLKEWATHGDRGQYTAKRLLDPTGPFDNAQIEKMRAVMKRYLGKPYDFEFRWSDDKIYCSELVWKLYKEALNVELCEPKPMRDHALGSEVVQRTMKERYGSTPPLDELMIAPGALFDCPLLGTVSVK